MIRGLYTAASGMLANEQEQDIVSNNLANANTTGFKEELSVKKPYPQKDMHRTDDEIREVGGRFQDLRPEQGPLNTGVQSDGSYTIFDQGPMEQTDNPLDVALQGQGFLVVDGPGEDPNLTRDGQLTVNDEGELVTSQGRPVLNPQDQPIQIDTESEAINITQDGMIVNNENQLQGQINIADVENRQGLEQVGDNLYRLGENEEIIDPPDDTKLQQGALEGSAVNPVEQMVKMVEVSREFEMNSRVLTQHDETLTQAVRTVGRA